MPVIKHEVPILEYDDDPVSVIMPDHESLGLRLPEKAVFAFLGDTVDRYAQGHDAVIAAHFDSITKQYPIYIVREKGREVCLCQAPVGAAAAAQILDWLIGHGVKQVIAVGSCGVLAELPENAFLVPARALRDEGVSYHYLPPSRFVEVDRGVLRSMERTLRRLGLPYVECTTWTTDGFFRETRDKIGYRKAEGCAVVEMECAALAACARFRGVRFGQLLYTADSLAGVERYDERGLGKASMERALLLALELVSDLRPV